MLDIIYDNVIEEDDSMKPVTTKGKLGEWLNLLIR